MSSTDILDNGSDFSLQNGLHGILVSYADDQLNECVRSALKRKSRVKYKCMDTFSNLLAFGTSGGAIYLFKLKAVSHSSCSLALMIPCDQGSIEVIKFLPNPQTDDLLVAIGTLRGSLVIFKLSQLPNEENPICTEIYRAESFTNNCAIKLIECDHDLYGLCCTFTKLYICDTANRLYVLESSTIYANKQTLRLFYTNNLPSLVFSVTDSKINQISVHLSQLLISTDETTRLFNEQTNQLDIIGKKKRKEGFYGSCFFNQAYKPARILQIGARPQEQSNFTSMNSINDLENIIMFVSRPMFRLWQVDQYKEVKFTHQFDKMIKSSDFDEPIELHNETIDETESDNPAEVLKNFLMPHKSETTRPPIKSDHFQKLVQMYSSTLGNLLLSYTRHELFVLDPIGAKLIVSYCQELPIVQVCCNENELYIWSLETIGNDRQFRVKRLVLLAPTQFVLELHRLHRYITLVTFVEIFSELFRYRMALPLSGLGVITIEGGLLRNVLLNAWDMYKSRKAQSKANGGEEEFNEFERMVEEIVEESQQFKTSFEDLTNSRFFLTMTNENLDRLCTEPYASLVSLEVSIKNLHTDHVIHFKQDALDRHRSVTNLSQSIQNLNAIRKKMAQSNYDLTKHQTIKNKNRSTRKLLVSRASVVANQSTNLMLPPPPPSNGNQTAIMNVEEPKVELEVEPKAIATPVQPPTAEDDSLETKETETIEEVEEEMSKELDEACLERQLSRMKATRRCTNCHWPRARSHMRRMDSSQLIQLRWMEENLMGNFEENIGKIEQRAFKYGLWQVFLKSLAYKNQTDEYITCCMLLDDVRLLDIEQFVIVHCGEVEILDRLLVHLGQKIDTLTKARLGDSKMDVCLKCGQEQEFMGPLISDDEDDGEDGRKENKDNQEDSFSFNMVNLFELFMKRRSANVKKMISCLLRHLRVLNESKLPTTFCLKALTIATLKANQSSVSRSRLKAIIN